ncbi:hypothetical protein EV121DRAFT_274728, partial [Schizophyllum commune]
MHFPVQSPARNTRVPPHQVDSVMDTCRIERRRSVDGAAGERTPAARYFARCSKPAEWRSSVIATSSTFPSLFATAPGLAGIVTRHSDLVYYLTTCACKRHTLEERPPYPSTLSSATPRAASTIRRGLLFTPQLVFLLPPHDDQYMTVDAPTLCRRRNEVAAMLSLGQQRPSSSSLTALAAAAPTLRQPRGDHPPHLLRRFSATLTVADAEVAALAAWRGFEARFVLAFYDIDMTYMYQTSGRLTLPPFLPMSLPAAALPRLFSSRRTSPMMRLARFWASSRPLIMPRVSLTISQIILRLLRRRRADPVPIPSNNRTSPSLTTPGQDGRRRARNPSRQLLHFGAVLADIPTATDTVNIARESGEDAVKAESFRSSPPPSCRASAYTRLSSLGDRGRMTGSATNRMARRGRGCTRYDLQRARVDGGYDEYTARGHDTDT